MSEELLLGFKSPEKEQFAEVIRLLLQSIDTGQVYFCGGIAISYHLSCNNKTISERNDKDLDICVYSLDAIFPKIKGKFEVVDLQHDLPGGYSFFAKLVEPHYSIKIDVFDNTFPCREPVMVQFESWLVKVRNAEDQLTKTVFDLQEVFSKGKIDTTPKQFDDARALWEIVDRQKAQNYWQDNVKNHPLFKGMPENLEEALVRAENYIKEHPEVFNK